MKFNNRLVGFDLLRIILCFSILVLHYHHFLYLPSGYVNYYYYKQPFYSSLYLLYDFGYIAIPIFWVLSGFIISYKYSTSIVIKNYLSFLIRRVVQLWPIAFVALVIVTILQFNFFINNNYFFVYTENSLYFFILNLFFIQNWFFQDIYSFNGPMWSVSVEFLAYIIYSFVIKNRSLNFFIFIFLLCLLFKIFFHSNKINDCLFYFSLGVIYFKYVNISLIKNLLLLFFSLTIFCANLYLVGGIYKLFLIKYAYVYIYLSLIFIALPVAILVSNLNINNKIIGYIGKSTYSIYAFHFSIQLFLIQYIKNIFDFFYNPIFFTLYIFICFSLGIIFYFLINKFMSAVNIRFSYQLNI